MRLFGPKSGRAGDSRLVQGPSVLIIARYRSAKVLSRAMASALPSLISGRAASSMKASCLRIDDRFVQQAALKNEHRMTARMPPRRTISICRADGVIQAIIDKRNGAGSNPEPRVPMNQLHRKTCEWVSSRQQRNRVAPSLGECGDLTCVTRLPITDCSA